MIWLFILGLLFTPPTEKLVKTKLSDAATIKLPASFYPMSERDYMEKYRTNKMPIAAYTDMDRVIDFSYNIAVNEWQDKDLEMLLTFNKSNIKSLHTKVDFLKEEVYEERKNKYAALEFVSTVSDQRGSASKYHYIVYTVVKRKIHVFSFNTPIRQKDQWQPLAELFMKTATVDRK